MKTIQKGDKIKRVDDETADFDVRNRDYSFISKKIWKENVRDLNKNESKTEEKEKKSKKNSNKSK